MNKEQAGRIARKLIAALRDKAWGGAVSQEQFLRVQRSAAENHRKRREMQEALDAALARAERAEAERDAFLRTRTEALADLAEMRIKKRGARAMADAHLGEMRARADRAETEVERLKVLIQKLRDGLDATGVELSGSKDYGDRLHEEVLRLRAVREAALRYRRAVQTGDLDMLTDAENKEWNDAEAQLDRALDASKG